ncbi:MAG: peptidase M48 [Candidatus Angelobacter sp. Gp1-AA117]|nr:MAG: peptidase M48 [Candidatus Angelobacter sp. Gp1-AA117]
MMAGAQDTLKKTSQQTTPQATEQHTRTTAYTLPPDKLAKSKALYDLDNRLLLIDTVYGFLILLGILYLGVAARYRDWAEKVSGYFRYQALIFLPLLLLTIRLLNLPLSIYGHHINLQYGLSVQGWSSWFADLLKSEIMSLLVFTTLLALIILLIRKSPRRWWFYSWLVAVVILLLLTWVAPIAIDPLYYNFTPLEKTQPQLVEQLEKVVQRGGLSIPRDRMYEMDASRKVTTLNAYVTGFGASKRVVVWDNTIQKMTIPETLFVFGHEMGHYVLNHIIQGIILGSLGLLLGFYVLYRLCKWFLPRSQQRWHIRELGDWAAVPMLLLLFGILGFIAEPIGNTISRHVEHEADIYGLEVTHGINPDPQEAAAHSFQMLGEMSLDYPYPSRLAVIWYWNHPPISDRVRFAREYDPWSKGEKPKFVK